MGDKNHPYKLREHMSLVAMLSAYVLLAAAIVVAFFLEWHIAGIVLVVLAVLACGFLTYAFVFDLRTFLKEGKKESKEDGKNDDGEGK